MLLEDYSYVIIPERTGSVETDVKNLLSANKKESTLSHVSRVASANADIARRYQLDPNAAAIAGLLHDISAVVKPSDMLEYAHRHNLILCKAEIHYPFLLHQRMSRIIAEEYFGVSDPHILSAIECHTTLKANASPADMALFIADKIAWDQPGRPRFDTPVRAALDISLPAASLAYIRWMNENGKVLCPHTNWNLACEWLSRIIL